MANQFYLWQKLLSRFELWKSEREKDKSFGTEKIINNIELSEKDFTAQILKPNELEKAYRFRYKIFCEELKWLPLNKEKKETDIYDQYSIHFGVFC